MLSLNEKQLFAPPDEFNDLATAHFAVISVPVEASISYGHGAALGPKAIIEASQQVELFDVEEKSEPYRAGIVTLAVPEIFSLASDAYAYGAEQTKEVLGLGKIPVVLGGDHSLSGSILGSVVEKYPSISILHFDAHSDLRDSYQGNKKSHASALRRCLDLPEVKKLVQVGIRNVSNESADGSEYDFILSQQERVKIYYAKDRPQWDVEEMVNELGENVYITFDVDALDPSIMPATGTPEPGGLDWYTTLAIVKACCMKKTIVGMDFVEFAPMAGFHAPDFLLAKLIYKTIGFINAGSQTR